MILRADRLRASCGLALALAGQMLFAGCTKYELQDVLNYSGVAIANPPEINEYQPGKQEYGVEGAITARQLRILKGLAWPQSYNDLKGTFGFPAHRSEVSDFYRIEGSEKWARIDYNGTTATGFSLLERLPE